MSVQTSTATLGSYSLTNEIIKLTQKGLTDQQIGRILGKHYKTIAYHRNKHGIGSGRSHKAVLTKQRRTQTVHKRTYKMIYNNATTQEQPPKSKIKHGLNAYVPLVCRGTGCPYRKTCSITDEDLSVGEPCIIETTTTTILSEQYCQWFHVREDNIADLTRIRHLIDIEIKLMRCNRLMAVNPELVYTIWEDEQPRNKLNTIARYDLLLMRERNRILKDLLVSTAAVRQVP